MEIELKYAIGDPAVADRIWEDKDISDIEEKNSRRQEEQKAVYFDTEDWILLKNDIAFRIRKEGQKIVAALKWNGRSSGALHTREELNINLGEGECPERPDPAIFGESEIGRELLDLLQDQELKSIMKVYVSRRTVRVDTGKSIFELAVDTGKVVTDSGNCPVCEAEIELYSGDQEEMLELGEKLQEKYDLKPEKSTKFSKGLALLGKI